MHRGWSTICGIRKIGMILSTACVNRFFQNNLGTFFYIASMITMAPLKKKRVRSNRQMPYDVKQWDKMCRTKTGKKKKESKPASETKE